MIFHLFFIAYSVKKSEKESLTLELQQGEK